MIALAAVLIGDPIPAVHQRLAQVSNWLGKRRAPEDLGPARFAMVALVALLAIGLAAIWAGIAGFGWLLVLIAASLAALHAITGICLGCEVYARLRRRAS